MLDVTSFSSEEIEEKEEAGELLGLLYGKYKRDYGVVDEPDNDSYRGLNPKKVIDFI